MLDDGRAILLLVFGRDFVHALEAAGNYESPASSLAVGCGLGQSLRAQQTVPQTGPQANHPPTASPAPATPAVQGQQPPTTTAAAHGASQPTCNDIIAIATALCQPPLDLLDDEGYFVLNMEFVKNCFGPWASTYLVFNDELQPLAVNRNSYFVQVAQESGVHLARISPRYVEWIEGRVDGYWAHCFEDEGWDVIRIHHCLMWTVVPAEMQDRMWQTKQENTKRRWEREVRERDTREYWEIWL